MWGQYQVVTLENTGGDRSIKYWKYKLQNKPKPSPPLNKQEWSVCLRLNHGLTCGSGSEDEIKRSRMCICPDGVIRILSVL